LIGHDEHEATYAAPGWPFGAEGAVLLINDGPDAPLEVQVRPKDAFDCSWDANAGYWTIKSRRGAVDASGAALRLLLRVTPTRAGAEQSMPAQAPAPFPAAPVPDAARARIAAAAARPVAAPAAASISTAAVPSVPTTAVRAPAAGAPAAGSPAAGAPAAGSPAAPLSSAGAPTGAAGARPAVWKPRTVPDPELTAVPLPRAPAPQPATAELDATYAPVPRQRVALAALALPRLSRYRETGAQALEIALNRAFIPAPLARDAVIAFAIDDEDTLQAITPAGREQIAVPATFSPVDGTRLELAACAPALADRYCALLRLPQPPVLPVAAGARFTFGRGAPMLAALRVLDSPRFLKNAAGTPASSADRLGLSRAAFTFEAGPDGWLIARQSPTQALYHLDEQMAFVATIDDATPEQPYRLPAGHHVVAGHYVLRFDA
jgi:hypothetical protein